MLTSHTTIHLEPAPLIESWGTETAASIAIDQAVVIFGEVDQIVAFASRLLGEASALKLRCDEEAARSDAIEAQRDRMEDRYHDTHPVDLSEPF